MNPFKGNPGLSRRRVLGVGAGATAFLAASGTISGALAGSLDAGDRILQVRNATLQIHYAGGLFLEPRHSKGWRVADALTAGTIVTETLQTPGPVGL